MIYRFLKRAGDIFLTLLGIIFLSPVFIIIGAVVVLESKGSPLFVHKRVGYHGKTVGILKFRTMVKNADILFETFPPEVKQEFFKNFKLADDPRITRIGGFLRKTSLDELPQLFNILVGQMSIVGPRPVTKKEIDEKYCGSAEKILSVKPGLTGYWQACGRSDAPYDKRIEMDLYYVSHMGIRLDLKIIFSTIGAVLARRGAV